MTMVTKIAIAVALAAFLAVPSASFAASKAKNSSSDLTKCEGGACTARNPDRDPNTSVNSQYYRRTHKKQNQSKK
jgi:uncharacterized membrane protein